MNRKVLQQIEFISKELQSKGITGEDLKIDYSKDTGVSFRMLSGKEENTKILNNVLKKWNKTCHSQL